MHTKRTLAIALTMTAALCGSLVGTVTTTDPAEAAPSTTPAVLPQLSDWRAGSGSLTITPQTRIVAADPSLVEVAEIVAGELEETLGSTPVVAEGESAAAGEILLSLGDGAAESYSLTIGEGVTIAGGDRDGVFYGTRTVLQMLRTSDDAKTLQQGSVTDAPEQPIRSEMLDVGRKYFPVSYLEQQIRQMSWYKLNTLHLHLTDWNGYRIESASHPEIVSDQHYTVAELQGLEQYAARYGVTIIPEVDLPGHSSAISAARPDLAFACESMSRPLPSPWEGAGVGGWTLDITKEETRAFSRDLVAEVADIFELSPYVHIGGDELPNPGLQAKCPELVAYQKAQGYQYAFDAFVEYANMLNDVVKEHGKQSVMWQWWNYQGPTSIDPDKDIIITEWLLSTAQTAGEGYQTIGNQDGPLYVSPGFGSTPGDYGYMNIKDVYENYAFDHADDNVVGYQLSRWSDRTQTFDIGRVDYFARRPIAVVAERTWGTPAGGDVREFLDRYDRIGDAPGITVADPANIDAQAGTNPGMLSQEGWTVTSSGEETDGEDGSAANAIDDDIFTMFHSKYSASAPHWLQVDTGSSNWIQGVRYMPRQTGGDNGRVHNYIVEVSQDATTWSTVAKGAFFNAPNVEATVPFAPVEARYVRFTGVDDFSAAGDYMTVAELDLVAYKSGEPATASPLESSASVRCLGGKAYLQLSVKNTGETVVPATVETPYGTKAFDGIRAGKVGAAALNTRTASIDAGFVTVTGGGGTKSVSYPATTCS